MFVNYTTDENCVEQKKDITLVSYIDRLAGLSSQDNDDETSMEEERQNDDYDDDWYMDDFNEQLAKQHGIPSISQQLNTQKRNKARQTQLNRLVNDLSGDYWL